MKYLRTFESNGDYQEHWNEIDERDRRILNELEDYILDLEDSGLNIEISKTDSKESDHTFFSIQLVSFSDKPLVLTDEIQREIVKINAHPEIELNYIQYKQVENDGRIFNKYDYDLSFPTDPNIIPPKLRDKKFALLRVFFVCKESNWGDDHRYF